MAVYTPLSGERMQDIINGLGENLKRELKHKETNYFPGIYENFSRAFGKSVDSDKLKVYVERYDTTFNVYWQMVDEAASYRVEIYKYIDCLWYKLTEICVERNNGYAPITDLVGDGFVFRVTAEDRSGNVVARSEGTVILNNTVGYLYD